MSDTSLVPIESLKAAEVFAPGGVDGLVAKVETDARALSKDIDGSTPKGRDDLKSLAYKVTRSKTALDEMGKDFVAELKREAGKIDIERRKLRERLDELRDEIRKPVDEFEAKEEARIAGHVANLEGLLALEQFVGGEPSLDAIASRALSAEGYAELDWEEFEDRANQLLARIPAALQARHAALISQEADRVELERLRKAEGDRVEAERLVNAEREQKERDERIAKDAAEEANRRAEAAELQAREAAAQAQMQRAQALRDREAAIEAERQRVANIAAQEAAETARREANESHRAKINREAVADLVRIAGLKEDQAKAVVIAIAQDKIRNLEIRY
jgi:regulator of replication initiation timing